MNRSSQQLQRRIAVAGRAALTAQELARIAALAPGLGALERPRASELAKLDINARAIARLTQPDHARIDADLGWLAQAGGAMLASDDPRYPALLRESPDPPAVLYVLGDPAVLAEPQIAMVGSRSCTAGGRETAHRFADWFARAGLCITSGLALGIDTASHQGALAGGGTTIAVLGCGLDICYPPQNASLARRIAESGAVVSEFPPGTVPLPGHFPQRNRIIAGLSAGTVVVEAASESGSLITARLAGVAGREVFAIPASIQNPLARGCHELIRQGAKLVERPEDVLCELKISLSPQLLATAPTQGSAPCALDKEYKILLDALAFEPASVDTLIERTGLNSESIASMLLVLELDGHVAPYPGGRYSRMAGQ
jgi:DNA processing protein